jgi:hypothetical protein
MEEEMLLKRFLFILIIIIINSFLFSGEIRMGSVPGSVVYQGRIEKNNAPLNGPLHLRFRLYREGSGPNSPDWESDEISTGAKNGIFSVTFTPPLNKLSLGTTMYLEVEIEGERLSPKEPIYAVPYALVAKKLEDGASVYFSSITVGPRYLLGVNPPPGASIYTDRICFSGDNSCLAGSNIGTITGGEVASPTTAYIRADTSGQGIGDILFQTSSTVKAIITNDGKFGIGIINPNEKLHLSGNALINGNLTVSNNLNIGSELLVSGILNQGVIRGQNNEQISIGVNDNEIDFVINGSTNVIINQSRLGIGKNPSYSLDVSGTVSSDQLITSTASIDFINTNSNLIIQNNLFNVGIGTNVVSEKLTVAGNVKASGDIFASSGVFTNNLRVDGNLKVNNYGSKIELSSTTVYGTLDVKGQFSINNDQIATLASTQTFSGKNTFLAEVNISSNLAILNRVGIGINSNNFAYPENSYLQIGDPTITTLPSLLYLSAGAASDSKINFYKGTSKIGYIGTDQNNIAVFIGTTNKKKLIINDQYFKIYNSTFIVSTSESDTYPSIYVSSNSYVGINTSNPTHNLTVNGNIRITGSGNMIIFPDGSTLSSGNLGSAGSVSNNTDAIILADADNNGTGKIFLRVKNINSLIIDNTGKIGIGTPTPIDKLHIMGGNIVVGNPNPYTSSGNGDIIVGGNLVIDGMLKQRSQIPVEFASLFVGGDVYLSTNTNAKVGIGTTNPQYKLDLVGDARISGDLFINGLSQNRIIATDANKKLTSSISALNLRLSVSGTTGTGNLVFSANPVFDTGITVNGWGNFSQGITASSGTFTNTGDYSILTSSGIKMITGTIQIGGLTGNRLVTTDGSKNLSNTIDSSNLAASITDETGTGNLVFNTNPTFNTGITINGWGNFLQGITTSSGTFTNTGDYSILTSSGIKMITGTIQIGGLTGNRLVTTDGSKNLSNTITSANLAASVIDKTGTGNLVFSTNPVFDTGITVNGWGNFSQGITASTLTLTGNAFSVGGSTFVVNAGNVAIGKTSPSATLDVVGNALFSSGITASSGTFTSASGIYSPQVKFADSVIISSASSSNYGGIYVSTHIYMANSRILGLPTPSDSSEAATKNYVDNATGGGSAANAWLKGGNNLNSNTKFGDTSNLGYDVIFVRKNIEEMRLASIGILVSTAIISNASITASTATLTGNAFSVGGSTFVVNAGNVAIGKNSPSATLDVVGNAVFSSGITASSGTFTSASGIYSPQVKFANNVIISSASSSNYGGIYVSTHIYLPSGSKYYGDGSGIININPGNISSGNLPSNVVASSITINTVYTAAIQDGAVTSSKIADGSIVDIDVNLTTAAIKNGKFDDNFVAITTAAVSGILPIAKGGTNNNSFTPNRPIIYDGTNSKLASTSFDGFSGSFTVVRSTTTSPGCIQLTFQYGILTSTAAATCP